MAVGIAWHLCRAGPVGPDTMEQMQLAEVNVAQDVELFQKCQHIVQLQGWKYVTAGICQINRSRIKGFNLKIYERSSIEAGLVSGWAWEAL